MAALLYAEVYLICFIVVALLLYWTMRSGTNSTAERWLRNVLIAFLLNFASNFFFTLFNGVYISERLFIPASYFFKTCYHVTLCVGVFAWCGYAETEVGSTLFDNPATRGLLLIPLGVPLLFAVINYWNHFLFYIDEGGAYKRAFMFQFEMGFLFVGSALCSVRLLQRVSRESDPLKKGHLWLTASFPLCILAAWILSFVGEAVPVICVSVMVELLCLYVGTANQQISVDKLTQVNNRQNLLGFMEYKLLNHDGTLFLLMIDVDYFKTINDTYGHLEGDAALIRVAQTLKRACGPIKRRPYIARYGGDEFIVVLEATAEEVQALCRSINEVLSTLSREECGYELKVSIGAAPWQPGMGPKELIAAADAELYKIKQARE